MTDDYLYDKRGDDPDVEQLERAVSDLKYRGVVPDLPRSSRHAAAAPSLPPWGWTTGKAPLLIAGLLGVCAAIVAWSAIEKRKADDRRGWKLTPVVVAGVDIAEGSMVTFEMMSLRSVPEEFITSSVVRPDSAGYVVDQKVLVPVQAGDPLLWTQFENTRAIERLSSKVHTRARAFTLSAPKVVAVGGWVRPNDHVDLIGRFQDPQTNQSVAVTLLQNVQVLATGKITGTTNVNLIPALQRDYHEVSLMVLPEEAELIALATKVGSLTMSLRGRNDNDVPEEKGRASINSMLSGERTRALQSKRFNTIQVIRAADVGRSP